MGNLAGPLWSGYNINNVPLSVFVPLDKVLTLTLVPLIPFAEISHPGLLGAAFDGPAVFHCCVCYSSLPLCCSRNDTWATLLLCSLHWHL